MKTTRSGRGGSEKQRKSKSVKIVEPEKSDKALTPDSSGLGIDDYDYGFGGWLRSNDGIEMLKLFVIGNSIVVFMTMSWPSMQTAYDIITDWLTGVDSSF